MSDEHPGQQKFLFWTDKRPIAPDLETKITCAIAEVMQEAGNAAVVLTPVWHLVFRVRCWIRRNLG